jgi:hypothetical protein
MGFNNSCACFSACGEVWQVSNPDIYIISSFGPLLAYPARDSTQRNLPTPSQIVDITPCGLPRWLETIPIFA